MRGASFFYPLLFFVDLYGVNHFLSVLVGEDGEVGNVKVLKSLREDLDDAVAQIIASSPKWEPGKQRERPVKVVYNFPVVFQLR